MKSETNQILTNEELDFLIKCCFQRILEIDNAVCECDDNDEDLIYLYDELRWYENLKEKLEGLKQL